MTRGKRHLFIISPDLGELYSVNDINDILRDLKEMKLNRLPYPIISIEYPSKLLKQTATGALSDEVLNAVQSIIFDDVQYFSDGDGNDTMGSSGNISLRRRDGKIVPSLTLQKITTLDGREWYKDVCTKAVLLLMVCLATKGTKKDTRERKLNKLGIGKKGYDYVTTISIPQNTSEHNEGNGSIKRPHIRRGHIRNQCFGPNNSMHKKIWIEPMLVAWDGGDDEFTNQRDRYHVSLSSTNSPAAIH